MERDTEDSRLKKERNRPDKQKSLKKNENDVQKKKLTDAQVEINFATVAEELAFSENIASQVVQQDYFLVCIATRFPKGRL